MFHLSPYDCRRNFTPCTQQQAISFFVLFFFIFYFWSSSCPSINFLSSNDSHNILETNIDDIVKEVSSVLYNATCLGDRDKRHSKNKKAKRKIKLEAPRSL